MPMGELTKESDILNNQTINVSTEQLENLAGEIQNTCDRLNNLYLNMHGRLEYISTVWESEAGQTFKQCIDPLDKDLASTTAFITEYARFLRLAVETYEECDRRLTAETSESAFY